MGFQNQLVQLVDFTRFLMRGLIRVSPSRLLVLLLFALLSSSGSSQPGPPQESVPAKTGDPAGRNQQADKPAAGKSSSKNTDDVVRISVTLVQVDAEVTDGKGRYITDLKPEDFEITEDGKPQYITNFSYVADTVRKLPPPDRNAPPLPSPIRPEQVHRTIALVVDDLGLSFESTAYLRAALGKFVDEQMEPGDLVGIIRTGSGMGALQQF